jgi:diketogulonate reductase-like aldo/keto reductase
MEGLVRKGIVRSIGFSNFNKRQIGRIFDMAQIRPSILQVECHPYLTQKPLIEFARSKKLAVTSYSPLGSPDRPWAKRDEPNLLEDPRVVAIAKTYSKTPAQILIRFQLQRGLAVIPKSVTADRIRSNSEVFDFQLSDDAMWALEGLNRNWRGCTPWDVSVVVPPEYPFTDEY